MNKGDFITFVSIVVTVLSIITGCIKTKEQPSCNIENITVNGGEVNIACTIENQ